jgi:hypothetical protein
MSGKLAAATSQLKKPRATNALEVFSQEQKPQITQKMAEKLGASSKSDRNNIKAYKESQQELWSVMKPETRAEYEEKAAEYNEKIKKGPTDKELYECAFRLYLEFVVPKLPLIRNQKQIIPNTISALRPLIGFDWKGHGDVVFFVQGAYRDRAADVRTFK